MEDSDIYEAVQLIRWIYLIWKLEKEEQECLGVCWALGLLGLSTRVGLWVCVFIFRYNLT